MLLQSAPASQGVRRVGVGLDTARYGHYASFLRDDLQPAAEELSFAESAAGYALFRQRLEVLVQRHGPVAFAIRLDAAGQYADNVLHFLHRLGTPTRRAQVGGGRPRDAETLAPGLGGVDDRPVVRPRALPVGGTGARADE